MLNYPLASAFLKCMQVLIFKSWPLIPFYGSLWFFLKFYSRNIGEDSSKAKSRLVLILVRLRPLISPCLQIHWNCLLLCVKNSIAKPLKYVRLANFGPPSRQQSKKLCIFRFFFKYLLCEKIYCNSQHQSLFIGFINF